MVMKSVARPTKVHQSTQGGPPKAAPRPHGEKKTMPPRSSLERCKCCVSHKTGHGVLRRVHGPMVTGHPWQRSVRHVNVMQFQFHL